MKTKTILQGATSSPITDEKKPTQWQSNLLGVALAAWTALLAFHIVTALVYPPPHQDQNWLLYAAQRALSGAQLYGPQIIETNPPLIVWFSMLPVLLAHLLHLEVILMFRLVVVAMICGSTAWSVRILRAAGLVTSRVTLYIAASSVLGAETWLSGFNMGQREHLLVILILPYILSAVFASRVKLSVAELCTIGVCCGVAVCFKPQQILVFVGLEIFLAMWTRSFQRLKNPAFISAVLAVFTYIALVRLITPLYFSEMIPILRDTYWAFGPYSAMSLIESLPVFNFFFVLTLWLFFRSRHKLRFAVASGSFLVCSLASYSAYCIQHTGFANREYPQEAFLLLAIFFIAVDRLTPVFLKSWKFNSQFAIALLISIFVLLPPLIIFIRMTASDQRYPDTVFGQYPPRTPVYTFSPLVSDGFPAVARYHLVWASRFPCLWMLPAIVEEEMAEVGGPIPQKVLPPATVKQLAAMQRVDTSEDFHKWKPEVVIVKHCHPHTYCHGLEQFDFDPLPWFLQSPQFEAEWSHYHFQRSHGDYDVYTRIH